MDDVIDSLTCRERNFNSANQWLHSLYVTYRCIVPRWVGEKSFDTGINEFTN